MEKFSTFLNLTFHDNLEILALFHGTCGAQMWYCPQIFVTWAILHTFLKAILVMAIETLHLVTHSFLVAFVDSADGNIFHHAHRTNGNSKLCYSSIPDHVISTMMSANHSYCHPSKTEQSCDCNPGY